MNRPDLVSTLPRRALNVGLLLFPDVEILDFAGPYEVFSVASRVAVRDGLLPHPPFRLVSLAHRAGEVVARHGLWLVADAGLAEAPECDLLIVPGGVVEQPLNDAATLAWLRERAPRAGVLASVCTGAFVLAEAGLLAGRCTTHWEDIPDPRARYPQLDVVEDVPFVDQGAVVTSAGISAGIDMSLHLVGRLLGETLADATARQMQYERRAT